MKPNLNQKSAKLRVNQQTDDVMKAVNLARALQQQKNAQQASPAAPQSGGAFDALESFAAELKYNPEMRAKAEAARPRTYADFNSAQELYDYRLKNTKENDSGNAVSQALQADIDALDRRRKELEREQWYHTADEMERINAQYSPEEAVYSPEQIALAREYESLPDYANQLDAFYTQRIGEEEDARRNKRIQSYENVRSNADYSQRVALGKASEAENWDAYYNKRRSQEHGRGAQEFSSANRKSYAKDYTKQLTNPAEWAAANAEFLLEVDIKGDIDKGESTADYGLSEPLYLYMTPEQRDVYSYYVATGGRKKADEYFDSIKKDLRETRNKLRAEYQQEWAADEPVAAFVVRAINQLGTLESIPESIKQEFQNSEWFGDGIDRPLDTSVSAFDASRRSRAYEEGITSNVDSELGRFLLNVGFSLSDNAVATGVGMILGPAGPAILLSAESGSAALYDAGERGLSPSEANKAALISGGWELLTEKIAFDELYDLVKLAPKSMTAQKMLNILRQAGVEASEEYANSLLSTMTERLFLGGNSSYDQYVRDMQAQGASYEEAIEAANLQFYWLQPLESAAAGAMSGGFMGTTGTVVADIANSVAPTMTEAERKAAATVVGISERANNGTATIADTVAEKVLTGQAPSNSEIRQLQNATTTIQRSFEAMTGIEVVGVDSSNLRASISAASKTPAITMDRAAEYINAVNQLSTQQAAATQTMQQSAPQYDALAYNNPDASAIGTIDAARQGGAPLEVVNTQDTGSAAGMAEDFQHRQRMSENRLRRKRASKMIEKLRNTGYYDDLAKIAEISGDTPEGYIIGLLEEEADAGIAAESERPYDLGDIRAMIRTEEEMAQYRADRIPKRPGAWQNFIKQKDTDDSYYGIEASEMRELIGIYDKADDATRTEIEDYLEDINYHTARKYMIREDYNSIMENEYGETYSEPSAEAEHDSTGAELSEVQTKFFKDSKVRDKSGRLIPMYHGSPANFTAFDGSKSRSGYLGYGFYFTENREYAEEYQYRNGADGVMHKTYLNITNPCDAQAPLDWARWKQVYDQIGLDSSWLQSVSDKAINDYATYHFRTVNGAKQVSSQQWRDAMQAAGWDGWIGEGADGMIAVTFESNQSKRTDNRNPSESDDIRFRLTSNQYNAIALYDALESDSLSDAKLANLTAQLRDRGIDLSENPDTQELLEAVDMLDTIEPGFVLNITEKQYKTAAQKAAEKAAREKAAADRAESKRLADEEKQRKAAEAEQKKAAIAERREKAEKANKKANKKAAPKAPRQKSITSLATEHKTGTAKVSGYNVNLTDPKAIALGLEGDARAEFVRQMESVNEFGKAFGHTVNYYYGRVGEAGSDNAGFYYNGKIYVNVNFLRSAGLKAVAHEICHDIAAREPSFVSTFYRLYREYCESNGLMSEFNRRWNEIYNKSMYPNKQLAIAEEVLAEKFGEYASGDSEFLNYCLGKRPGIIARIVEALNRILTKLHLKKYSKASADAMELRNFLLGTAARYQMNQTGRDMKLSAGIRSDYRNAQRKAETIGDRYVVFGDRGVNLAEWDTTGLAASKEYKNLNKKAPNEVTDYGFKQVIVNGKLRDVLIVNPTRYINEGVHADMIASSRSLAASLGLRLGFISGDTSEVVGKGRNRREQVIDADFLMADGGRTLYINLDSEVPYTKIVAGAWWSQYRKSNPAAAANLERLAERNRALSGDDRIAQDYAVGMLTRTNAQGLKALALGPETLVEKLSDSKSAVYAFAHEKPGIMRKLFENAGDMVAKLTKKQDYRAAYISGQLQARLMKAFSETSPNRPGGDKIETVKRKTAPDGVLFSANSNSDGVELSSSVEATRKTTDPVDTYKRRDLRSKISKEVKALSAALVTPSDKKHIPSRLTSAIADFLKEFTNDTSVFTATKLAVLRDAYDRLSDTGADSDMDVSYAYDPDISETISELSDTIDGRRLAQLDMDETVKVKNIVQHFKHLVTAENKLFLEGRKRDVAAIGSDIMNELRQRPAARTKADQGTFKAFTDMLTSGNITPAYFFKRIGGTMESLFKSMRSGQNVWATNMRQAQQTYESIFKKHHADKWLNKRNDTLTFTTERGDNITLTRQQALTLYATHQREVTNQIQEAGHLSLGGFVYEDAVKTKRGEESVDTTKAHPLNANDMRRIIDWLTDEQIQFADELVGYMSGDLAKLGNETSLKLHGWEKFTESYYFPYNSAENYLYTKQAVTEDRRLKHMSFTKSTVRKANNPIILSDFTQVWANHVQNMLMYSSLAVPLEDFNRVYNYKTSVTEDSTSRSVKEALEKAYGKNANAYIRQLMTDINGGVTPPRSEGFFNRMMSKFRKSAVFASASVVVQQPSAIGRAMAMIDPKYFVASTFQRKSWEECKRWCGVALIKEMGRFDTSTGRGAADWLIAQPYRGVQKVGAFFTDGDFRDDVLSAPAAKADAYTWSAIWNACKREAVREKGLQPNSKELYKAAAERFDEVINFTQVYDSVFARSELMRSKSGLTKAMTAFMSEPTVTYNMLLDSVVNARRKDVKNKVNPARAVGAFILSATINAVLKSLVTALREEDEDKTYVEKYLGELVENFESDTNLLSLIPYVRDLISLAKGYSVENTAYDVPKDFIEAGGDILEWIEAHITGDDTNVDINTALLDLGDAISAGFGIPVKNIRRDAEAIYNTVYSTKPLSETSKAGILDSILSKTQYYDNRKTANYGRLVDAYVSGDADKAADIVDRLLVSGTEESSIVRGTKSVVKTEYLNGRISGEEAIKFLVDHGNADADDAYWLIQEWDYNSTKGDDDPNFSKYLRLRNALDADDKAEIHDAAVELLEHGVSVKTLKSETKKHAGSSSILYRSGLADYLDEDKEKEEGSGGGSGGSGGRSSGGSSGRSSAKSAATTSINRGGAKDAGEDLNTIKPASSQTLRKPTTQSGGRVNTDSPNGLTISGGTDPTIPSAGQTGIFNAGCANNENGSCRIGRTSCENCPYATNK